jgi:hypothetical protein
MNIIGPMSMMTSTIRMKTAMIAAAMIAAAMIAAAMIMDYTRQGIPKIAFTTIMISGGIIKMTTHLT